MKEMSIFTDIFLFSKLNPLVLITKECNIKDFNKNMRYYDIETYLICMLLGRLLTLLLFQGMITKLKQTHKIYPSDLFLKYISSFLMVSVPGV